MYQMFFLIWWILIIDCVVEFKIIYGNERVIITVPMHIKQMHHTKMIYKIIEKPVPADTIWTPSTDQMGYRDGPMPHDGARGDENQTVATAFGHHERGPGPVHVDHHRGRGYDANHPHGDLRDGDPSKWSTAHDALVGGPHGHVDAYRSNANGAGVQQRQRHVHGPRHHVRGHSVEAVHGHFGGVLRAAGDHERGGGARINRLKAARLGDHRHRNAGGSGRGNAGSAWRAQDASDPSFRGQSQHGLPGPHQHGDVATGTGGARDQRGRDAADATPPGQDAAYRDLGWYGFPKSPHDHQSTSDPVYGHRGTGGYQVQENVADFNGIFSIAVPPKHRPTSAQAYHNNPSPVSDVGSDNTVDRMPSVLSIASPPIVNNVYYTLDPVVPYNDVALRSQRKSVGRRSVENVNCQVVSG